MQKILYTILDFSVFLLFGNFVVFGQGVSSSVEVTSTPPVFGEPVEGSNVDPNGDPLPVEQWDEVSLLYRFGTNEDGSPLMFYDGVVKVGYEDKDARIAELEVLLSEYAKNYDLCRYSVSDPIVTVPKSWVGGIRNK